jgi:AraC family transcriptional regulator
VEAVVGRRFRLPRAPTLASATSRTLIAFTHLECIRNNHGRSGPVPTEAAFAFQVMLQPLQSWDLRSNRGQSGLPPAKAGDAFLFDLSENPRVGLRSPFDMVRFYLPQVALDDLTYERGLRPIGGLKSSRSGTADPILHGMVIALSAAMKRPSEVQTLFVDSMALAVHAHVVHAYGGAPACPRSHGGLAAWQLRRATETMAAGLNANISVAALAHECGLSANYFIRAFRRSTGVAPHQWLLRQRIDRARTLMRETEMDLTSIALACGFVDQSHFSRVFTRFEKLSPGRWRRTLEK